MNIGCIFQGPQIDCIPRIEKMGAVDSCLDPGASNQDAAFSRGFHWCDERILLVSQ